MTEVIAGGQGQHGQDPGRAVPEDLYGSWSPTPSPDGSRVALISDRGGEPGVWLHGPDTDTDTLLPLPQAPRRVLRLSWSPDGSWLACQAAAAEASRTQVWVIRPDGTGLQCLAGAGMATAELGGGARHGWSADGRVLVTETEGGRDADCVLVDPGTGEQQRVAVAPLARLVDVSADATLALVRLGPRGARRLAVVDLHGEAAGRLIPVDLGPGEGSVEQGCLSPDATTVYARSDVGRDRAVLVAVDLATGRRTVLAERADDELENVVLSADGRRAALAWNVHGGRSAMSILDLDAVPVVEEQLSELPRDVVDDHRFSADGTSLLVTAEDWADPRGVWVLDLATGDARPLSSRAGGPRFASRGATTAAVTAQDIARPQLRQLRSDDGLALTGWLYCPPGPPPWPTMIHLHGGPESQERPVYNSLFQSLVAGGIAVFAPNVRGSAGFGRAFVAADDREHRYDAIADVAACATYLVGDGVAKPDRIGVMGRSYGGWLTQAALVWHPELFAVGMSVCGMSDFENFYADTEPWIAAAAVAEYGDPVTDAALLRDLSPLHRIDALRAPLLVVHGGRDTNVPVSESRRLVAALAARGAVHEYLEFPDEGHELLQTPNRVAFVQAAVAWAQAHLVSR